MPDLAQDVRLSFLRWLANEDTTRADNYRAYREYYDGDHDTQLTERQRKYLQIKFGEEFRSNYCPIVVDALAEKLKVTGFSAGEDQGELMANWWQKARMDAVQSTLHTAAVRDGDAYLIVEWDNDRQLPRFTFEPAYDGASGVRYHYSDEQRGVPAVASKRWRIERGEETGYLRRMNLYYPNRIEKYVSNQREFEGAWQQYAAEGESWPIWWTRTGTERGEPLGMPVLHFKNKDVGNEYGESELRDVVPLQNALNKSIIDLLAAADTTAFRIFWMLGDDPSSLSVSPGSWIYSTRPPGGDQGVSVGYFPGEDLATLINLKDAIALEIARVTRTPISYFQAGGQRPAEGTLKQEEVGIVGKAKDRQIVFGNGWEDAMSLARKLWNLYGPGPALDEDEDIATLWADVETRNEQQHMDGLKVKAELGVPRKQLWREMGYDDATIAEMLEMIAAEDQGQATLGDMLLRQFERGGATLATEQEGREPETEENAAE